MKLKKRGAVEVQFNWLFILIAGAVILLFFGTVMTKQRTSSEQKITSSLLVDLESILTGSIVSKQALNFISIPKKEINFEGCDFYYMGKKDEATAKLKKDIKEKVIFTPNLIKGTRLTIWSLPWNIPYRVTNFLYLTSPQVRYIIVYDSEDSAFANTIEGLLPPKTLTVDEEEHDVMLREKTTLTGFSGLNNYKVKFILIDKDPDGSGGLSLNDFKTDDISAVKVEQDVGGFSGELKFYKKTDSGWSTPETSYYFGDAALIGAIFAEDRDAYECAMRNAFKRMKVVTDVYIRRTDELVTDNCDYQDSLSNLNNIKTATGEFGDIIDAIKTNQITDQDKNCPLIY